MMDDALATPQQRRANLLLGLALGAVAVAIMLGLMGIFRTYGLPKDPEVWRRMEQERSAARAAGGDAPATQDARAAAAAGEQR